MDESSKSRGQSLVELAAVLPVLLIILAGVIVFFGLFPSVMLDVIQTSVIPFMNGLP